MPTFTTQGILLRRTEYGDHDWILTLFSQDLGKIGMMAKFARKSKKRFAGALELFSQLQVVCSKGRGKSRLPILQEAVLCQPYSGIRESIWKTAHASYWAELVALWLEEAHGQPEIYQLLDESLMALDQAEAQLDAITVIFQYRFLILAGLGPHLERCTVCRRAIESSRAKSFAVSVAHGGVVCAKCREATGDLRLQLARGTIKQLAWVAGGDLNHARRARFSAAAMQEAQQMLEAFIPYHLGKRPRSLKVLNQLRNSQTRASG